jgi:hypothetical protein
LLTPSAEFFRVIARERERKKREKEEKREKARESTRVRESGT